MEYYRKVYEKADLEGNELRIHPLCCWHIGAAQCDLKFIEDTVAEIRKDPAARWIYMGDGGECVTKLSKGNIFEQTLSPQLQTEMLQDLLSPIAGKGICGIRGNHGNRINKETGLGFDKGLLTSLRVPYLGISAITNLVVNRSSYTVYIHHGVDGGVSLQAKVNAAAKHFHILADVRITGHSHMACELEPMVYRQADNHNKKIENRVVYQYVAGSAYDSTAREGYAEEKGYTALLPGRIRVALGGKVIHGESQYSVKGDIVRSPGNYDTYGEMKTRLRRWEDG